MTPLSTVLFKGPKEVCYRFAVQGTHQVFVKVEFLLVVCRRYKLHASPLTESGFTCCAKELTRDG